jgi:3-phosphoshikimate 1-carboxyvinyltransferase
LADRYIPLNPLPLPDLIEIVPLERLARATVSVPGSKSLTNRALILAALADGETLLRGALWSEDTQVMAECLQELGFMVNVEPDPGDPCNRQIAVYGKGGAVPPGGTEAQPLELFVGNAGTAARFLTAFLCLGRGVYRLHGVPRMHERPQADLFKALRQLGYRVDSPNDRLPALVFGAGPHEATCQVSIEESSQFGSALLLAAQRGKWRVEVTGENAEESAYLRMTADLLQVFPQNGGRYQIEPDASSGSYFWAAGALPFPGRPLRTRAELLVTVANWPQPMFQPDAAFPQLMPLRGVPSTAFLSRKTHLGDSIMTAIVMAPFMDSTMAFGDLGRLRLQECERVQALRTELTKCGARVLEKGDTLEIFPSDLHGADINTYNDHRMAMCFAILGLKVPGIKIQNPSCVKKTFPNFFQKLVAPPPIGLGATVRDGREGRLLRGDDLFAA